MEIAKNCGSAIRFCMKWDAFTFDWSHIPAFLATAEEGSLSAAARVLQSTQPTVGRQVAALEAALGVTLFERTSRSLMLTQAGRELLVHVRDMGEAAQRVSVVAAAQSQDVAGTVSISASDMMASHYLPVVIADLQRKAPGLRIIVNATNEVQDLIRREADIAIRHVRPEQPELIGKLVGSQTAGLYAARNYLNRHGRPASPTEIAGHPYVALTASLWQPERIAQELQARGFSVAADQIVSASDSGTAVLGLVRAGAGISVLPDVLARRLPELERLFPEGPELEFPTWLVTHRELQTSRRFRLVFDALDHALRDIDRWMQAP